MVKKGEKKNWVRRTAGVKRVDGKKTDDPREELHREVSTGPCTLADHSVTSPRSMLHLHYENYKGYANELAEFSSCSSHLRALSIMAHTIDGREYEICCRSQDDGKEERTDAHNVAGAAFASILKNTIMKQTFSRHYLACKTLRMQQWQTNNDNKC